MGTRVTLTVKLTVGKDDDLIEWLAAFPKGTRQAQVKQILRSAVQDNHGDEHQLTRIEQDTAWLRMALTEMPTWIEGLLSRVAVIQAPEAPPDGRPTRMDQLSTEGVTRREKHIAKATW